MQKKMQPDELNQESLQQIKSNLQQYSKHLSVLLSVCLIILVALFAGNQIELLSVKLNFIWGSILGFLIICVLLIFASGSAKNILELIGEEHYSDKKLLKLNNILVKEPNLFNPLSIEEQGSVGAFIMLILSILVY